MAGVVAVVGVLAVVVFAAGGSGLPAAPPCATPTATPPSLGAFGRDPRSGYASALRQGLQQLNNLLGEYRGKYPTDAFYRDSGFRSDFVTYADSTVCDAQAMVALQLPSVPTADPFAGHSRTNLSAAKKQVDGALSDLISFTALGRSAVASRNVTKYQQWYAGIGGKMEAINAAIMDVG